MSRPGSDTLHKVISAAGVGYQIRPFRKRRGTFLIERIGGKHRAPALVGISKRAAAHYVLTMPRLKDRRAP